MSDKSVIPYPKGGVFLGMRADRFLDIREYASPIVFLLVCRAFSEMEHDETLEILLMDAEAGEDLFKILPASGYAIIKVQEEQSFYRIILKKKIQKRR